jgi:hypothetical protein
MTGSSPLFSCDENFAKMVSKPRPKLLPIQPLCSPDIPPQFRKHAISQLQQSPFLTDLAPLSGSSSILAVPQVISDPRVAYRKKALRQRRELFSRLSVENLNPRDLFAHLATCNTPYSKLFRIASDELEFMLPPSASQTLDALAAESAIESTKREIDCQHVSDKLKQIQEENAELARKIQSEQQRLDSINSDITNSQHLLMIHGLNGDENMRKTEIIENQAIGMKTMPQVDQQLMTELWKEQGEILELITELEGRLRIVQNEQMIVLHERAVKSVLRR